MQQYEAGGEDHSFHSSTVTPSTLSCSSTSEVSSIPLTAWQHRYYLSTGYLHIYLHTCVRAFSVSLALAPARAE